jgi:RNA polymerase subunit RPABC4/transcription elongation factor Spt4
MIDQLLTILPQVVTALTLVTAVFLTSLWLGMVLWTFRDIRSRSRDIIVQLLATLMVGILTLPGLLVYFLTRPRETLAEAYEHALEQEALLQAIEEPEVCSGCGTKVNPEFQYCPYCHTQLKKVCVACEKVLDLDWNICPYCGATQGSQIMEPVLDREIDPQLSLPEEIPPESV